MGERAAIVKRVVVKETILMSFGGGNWTVE